MKVDRRKELGVKTSQQWLLDGNYDHLVNDSEGIHACTSLAQDKIKDFQRRITASAGYGWQVFETGAPSGLTIRTGSGAQPAPNS